MTTVDTIRAELQRLGLDSRGNKSTIKARLRKHLKMESSTDPHHDATVGESSDIEDESSDDEATDEQDPDTDSSEGSRNAQACELSQETEPTGQTASQRRIAKNSRYDYMLAFDVEATCETGIAFDFPNEIIEFPVVLLDGKTLEVVDEFHSYVRPTHRPILSKFCKDLTGIQQETIDAAPTFVQVLAMFEEWLKKHGIIIGEYSETRGHGCYHSNDHPSQQPVSEPTTENNSEPKKKKRPKRRSRKGKGGQLHLIQPDFEYGATFCFVTDGPFDIRDFITKQCLHSQIPRPSYFTKPYLDVRTRFRDYFDLATWLNLEGMLQFLGTSFVGRQHSGICDARMVGFILKRLAQGFIKDYEEEGGDNDDSDHGHQGDAIFNPANMALVVTEWDEAKIAQLAEGCVLKSNRHIDQARVINMQSFERIAIALGPQPQP
ncbi:hypothetical protein BGZ94_000060 [Podila epigama]|nr:hypothetical protein BGZ94_000060 [Podila epigama]